MKFKSITIKFIFVLTLLSNNIFAQWTKIDIGTKEKLYSLNAYTEDTVFINSISYNYKSLDGGSTWGKLPIQNQDSIAMPASYYERMHHFSYTNSIGIGLVDAAFNIARSEDSDTTCTLTNPETVLLADLAFPENYIGYIVGKYDIIKTSSASSSISRVYHGNEQFYSVDFYDEDNGIASGINLTTYDYFMLRTNDGGETWNHIAVDFGASAIDYVDNNIIYAGGEGVYKSTDGGLTWQKLLYEMVSINDLYAINKDTIFAVGERVWRSLDGGITWEYLVETVGPQLNDIDFYNNIGYIVGDSGVVYKSNDLYNCGQPSFIGFSCQDTICHDTRYTITNVLNPSYSFEWFINGESVSTDYDLTYYFDTAGLYEIKLVATNDCYSDSSIRHMYVKEMKSIDYSITFNDSTCWNKNIYTNIINDYNAQARVDILNINNDTINTFINNFSFKIINDSKIDTFYIYKIKIFTDCDTLNYTDTIKTHFFGVDISNISYNTLKDTLCKYDDHPVCVINNPVAGQAYHLIDPWYKDTVSALSNGDTLYLKHPYYIGNYLSGEFMLYVTKDVGTLHCWRGVHTDYKIRFARDDNYGLEIYDNDASVNDTINLSSKTTNIKSINWFFDTTACYNIDTGFTSAVAYNTVGIKKYTAISISKTGCLDTVTKHIGIYNKLNDAKSNNCFLDTLSQLKTSSFDDVNVLHIDKSGNYLLGGFIKISSGIYSPEAFLEKHDKDGLFKWRITANRGDCSYINSIQSDDNGNTYFCGRFVNGYITFGNKTFEASGHEREDLFIAKANSKGNVDWIIGSVCNNYDNNVVSATDILYVNDDSIFVFLLNPNETMKFTNETNASFNSENSYAILLQINSHGEYVNSWNIKKQSRFIDSFLSGYFYRESGDYSRYRTVSPNLTYRNGKIIVSGKIFGEINFGDINISLNKYRNFYITLNPQSGKWENLHVLSTEYTKSKMSFDKQGNVYLIKRNTSAMGFSGRSGFDYWASAPIYEGKSYCYLTPNDSILKTNSTALVYKCDSNDNLVWYRPITHFRATNIEVLNDDSIAVFGVSYKYVGLIKNGKLKGFNNNGNVDATQISFNSNGDLLNYNTFGGKTGDDILGVSISECGNLSILTRIADTTTINGDAYNGNGNKLSVITMPLGSNTSCIIECQPISISLQNIADANYGVCNGLIDVKTNVSSNLVNYLWNTGDTTNMLTGLKDGTYTVTVENSINGNAQASFDIKNTYKESVSFVDTFYTSVNACVFNDSLPVDSAFIIDYNAVGTDSVGINWIFWQNKDSMFYTQIINTNEIENSLSYLEIENGRSNNIYNFYGVIKFINITINLQNIIDANNGLCNGLINVNTNVSSDAVNYLWDTGDTTDILNGLNGGTYTVSVESPINGNAQASFNIKNTYKESVSFVDTFYTSVNACIFNNSLPVDSAFITDYNIIGTDSVGISWVFWQNEDSIFYTQIIKTNEIENSLVYLEIDNCSFNSDFENRSNSTNIYRFYGVIKLHSTTKIQKINNILNVNIYPNPAKDFVNIKVNNDELSNLSIYDISGKLIQTKSFNKTIQIETESLNKGVYIFKIKTNKDIITKRIVIE